MQLKITYIVKHEAINITDNNYEIKQYNKITNRLHWEKTESKIEI